MSILPRSLLLHGCRGGEAVLEPCYQASAPDPGTAPGLFQFRGPRTLPSALPVRGTGLSIRVYYVSPILILASTLQQFAFKCVVRELPEIFNSKTDLHFNMLLKNFKLFFFLV